MIAGTMRLYPGSIPTLPYALKTLAPFIDRLYVLLHNLRTEDLPPLPEGTVTAEWNGPWNHGQMLTRVFHLVDADKPDWVLIPDSDDILPPETLSLLTEADRLGRRTVSFPFRLPWDGFRTEVDPKVIHFGPHVKAVRWAPNVDFNDPAGFCVPRGYWHDIHGQLEYPLLHLCYFSPELRATRRATNRSESYIDRGPPLIPAPVEWRRYEEISV